MTEEQLMAVARDLEVSWPTWYRVIVLQLAEASQGTHGRSLPGGFLYANPSQIIKDTLHYRRGDLSLYSETPQGLQQVDWPHSMVVVGNTGDGCITVDTASEEALFYNIYKENYTLQPFIRVTELADSPEAFARMLIEHDTERASKRADRRRSRR